MRRGIRDRRLRLAGPPAAESAKPQAALTCEPVILGRVPKAATIACSALPSRSPDRFSRGRLCRASRSAMAEQSPTPQRGADILVQCLVNQGVEVLFAYPGGASM